MGDLFNQLVSANEQDRAECREWWCAATDAEKLAVWACIQQPHADPVMEVMTRFAQLAFAEMAEQEGAT